MALTISVGFVVDDAIVMIENIVRYIERGEAPFAAAIKGAGQIGFTIVSITFSLIAVFIPLLFMGGIIGRLFREFAVTVTVAVVASAFVSLTLTPMMCSRFLKHEEKMKQGRLSRGAEGFFNAMLRDYDRGLRWVFRHQLLMLVSTLCLIVLTGYLYIVIPKGFIPQQDTGFIFGALQTRQDASFAAVASWRMKSRPSSRRIPRCQAWSALPVRPDTIRVKARRGCSSSSSRSDERDGVETVIARLKPQIAKLRDVKFFMQAGQDVTVGGRLVQAQYQYTLDR